MDLNSVFEPESVAIIGASRDPSKIGNAIVKNFVEGGFAGRIFPINPKADELMGLKCYASVSQVPGRVDSAIVAIPAQFVPEALEECGEKGVKSAVVISGGFAEVGNIEGETRIIEIARKYDMAVIGPNCMGVLNPSTKVDSVFLPLYKLERPKSGKIGFISQSGAVGGCIVDLAARAGIGISKFVSYGNASVVDETSLLEYLRDDEKTGIIAMYLEGAKRGKEFARVCREITRKKPLIVLKAGTSSKGAEAAKSHTAALAGSSEAYKAVFRQARVTEAESLMELFYFSKVFDQPLPKGKRVAIITNGGGSGVLAVDALESNSLELAEFSEATKENLRKNLPATVSIRNPLDLIGDANSQRFETAVQAALADDGVDAILVIVLFQTLGIDSTIVSTIVRASEERKKTIVVMSTGGELTEVHKRILDSCGVPTYQSPTTAMRSIGKAVAFAENLFG
jgi:acetyl coenzyme A synthetase (ADP forming)-like protein